MQSKTYTIYTQPHYTLISHFIRKKLKTKKRRGPCLKNGLKHTHTNAKQKYSWFHLNAVSKNYKRLFAPSSIYINKLLKIHKQTDLLDFDMIRQDPACLNTVIITWLKIDLVGAARGRVVFFSCKETKKDKLHTIGHFFGYSRHTHESTKASHTPHHIIARKVIKKYHQIF